jgi:hypothetical protein
MPTRRRALFSLAIFASLGLVACAVTGDDEARVDAPSADTTVGPRSDASGLPVTKHLHVATTGSVRLSVEGSGYITTHEIGHAGLNFVDEYTEAGLDELTKPMDVASPHLGQLELGGIVRSTKDLLAWRRDTANGIITPKTIDLVVTDADGNDALTIHYEGALPKVSIVGADQTSQSTSERFAITYTKETWEPVKSTKGVSVRLTSTATGPFVVPETAGGRACSVSIIGPEIIGPEIGQIIGPERVGIIGPERSRVRLAIDGATSKYISAQQGAPFSLSLATPVAPNQQGPMKFFECFLTGYSLTPLDGDADGEECTESIEILNNDSGSYLG